MTTDIPTPAARRYAEQIADGIDTTLALNRETMIRWLAPILDAYVMHYLQIKEIEESSTDARDRVLIALYNNGSMNPEELAEAIFPDQWWQHPERQQDLTNQIKAILAALESDGLVAFNETTKTGE